MDPITIGLIAGGGLGLLKSAEAQKAAQRERQVQAQMARYSPWTGMQGHSVQDPSMLGNVSQGALSGAMLGQSLGTSGATAPEAAGATNSVGPLASGYKTPQAAGMQDSPWWFMNSANS